MAILHLNRWLPYYHTPSRLRVRVARRPVCRGLQRPVHRNASPSRPGIERRSQHDSAEGTAAIAAGLPERFQRRSEMSKASPPPGRITPALRSRLRRIKLFLCDVDGVLTDGSIYIGGQEEVKRFNIRDGLGMVLWRRAGYKIGWVSARPSPATRSNAGAEGLDPHRCYRARVHRSPAWSSASR